MTNITELAKRLREHAENMYVDFLNEAAGALEAQAKRIAELEVPLCIGRRTIGIMAEEGEWQSENGRAVVAADELFKRDPYACIAELKAALNLADKLAISVLGSWDAFEPALRSDIGNTNYRCVAEKVAEYRAARAALNGEK